MRTHYEVFAICLFCRFGSYPNCNYQHYFIFYFLLMPLLWSHTDVCSGSGRRFYALYTEIWHQDWLRIGCANSIRICHLYYACIQAGACNLIVHGIDGLSLPPPTAPRPNHLTPGTSMLLYCALTFKTFLSILCTDPLPLVSINCSDESYETDIVHERIQL